MTYFPTSSETPAPTRDDPHLVGLDEEAAGDTISSLSSATAREILAYLQENPSTAPEIADAIDTSLQNVHYHLDRLVAGDVVVDVDTVYSEKGREMAVYEAAGSPLLLVAGEAADRERLADQLSELLGSLGLVALVSIGIQRVVPQAPLPPVPNGAGAGGPVVPVGLGAFLVGSLLVGALLWTRHR